MMKFLLLALAITAIAADVAPIDSDMTLDELLEAEEDTSLPCTPKPCVPICKPTTKYMVFGVFKIPYTENVCTPDAKCLSANAACIKILQAAMVDAAKKEAALKAASAAKNKAGASKATKDKAAAAKKAEAAAAKNALDLAKKAFEAAEKEAAAATASKVTAIKVSAAKTATMNSRLVAYENAKKGHLDAVAAYEGAKSAAAKAAAEYTAAVKAHCDAEAQHATAVKYIGHAHMAKNTCKSKGPAFKVHSSCKKEHINLSHCVGDNSGGHGHVRPFVPGKSTDKGFCKYKRCGTNHWTSAGWGHTTYSNGKLVCRPWGRNNHNYVWEIVVGSKKYYSSEENAKARGTKVIC
jgi:hypothetical protein